MSLHCRTQNSFPYPSSRATAFGSSPADVGPEGLMEAAQYAKLVGLHGPPSLVQMPHHGSRRNVTPTVLNEGFEHRLAPLSSMHGARRSVLLLMQASCRTQSRKFVTAAEQEHQC
jgi:hypothetical protein